MSKKDYLNVIKSNNSKQIEELNKMVTDITDIIDDYTKRKKDCENQIAKLSADNTTVDEIIKDVPVTAEDHKK